MIKNFFNRLLLLTLVAAIPSLMLVFLRGNIQEVKAQIPPTTKMLLSPSPLGWKPPYRLPGNKNLPRSSFLTQEEFLKAKYNDAVFKSFSLMTYRQYVKKYPESGVMYSISPDRMIAVTAVEFPKGLQGPVADYCSATVVTYRDAQTRQVLGDTTKGKIKFDKGPAADFDKGKPVAKC